MIIFQGSQGKFTYYYVSIFLSLTVFLILANSGDHDGMLQNAAFHLCLLCLLKYWFPVFKTCKNFQSLKGTFSCAANLTSSLSASRGWVPFPHQLFSCLQLLSLADNLWKRFGSRSGPTGCRSWSGSKLFDTLIVFLKELLEKVNFEKKISRQQKKHGKITQHAKS